MERQPDRGTDRGSVGYQRTVAFSDGVFAIAITLLVLGIDVPNVPGSRLGDAVRALGPSVARRDGLLTESAVASHEPVLMSLLVPVIFCASIPIAYVDADAAKWFWLSLALVPRLLRYTGLVQRA